MFTTRVQGRNSREALATAELLAAAAAAEGRQAAVTVAASGASLCTIDGRAACAGPPPLADALIVQDPGEVARADVFARLSPEAYVLVNSTCGFGDLGVSDRVQRFCRDRTLILPVARLEPGLPDGMISGSLLGGFAALCRVVSLDSVVSAIQDRMPERPARACAGAAAAAHAFVRAEREALAA